MQVVEFSGQRQLIGYPMEARKMVRAPVREMRAEMSVISACCARTVAPLGNGGRGLKQSFPLEKKNPQGRAPRQRGRGLKHITYWVTC